jgi:hypothetical protein
MAVKKLESESPRLAPRYRHANGPESANRSKKLKLGKGTARHDPRALLLATYMTAALPAPPASLDISTKVGSSWA